MNPPLKIHLPESAILLLVCFSLLACNLSSLPANSSGTPLGAPDQPAAVAAQTLVQSQGEATLTNEPVSQASAPTGVPVALPGNTATPPAGSSGSGSLAISNTYKLPPAILGSLLAAGPGKVWLGSAFGNIEEFDWQTGAFGKSILLPLSKMAVNNTNVLYKIGFDGQNLWALGGGSSGSGAASLFFIDPTSGTIIHQWDLTSADWQKNFNGFFTDDNFEFSPGKIWLQSHVIDTQTFEVTYVSSGFPTDEYYAYNGNGWMWMTGSYAEDCDQLIMINTDDPSKVYAPCHMPFLNRMTGANSGLSTESTGSLVTFAGDRMWLVGQYMNAPNHIFEAYSTDMNQLMKETKPLVIVPWTDVTTEMKMLYAGNYLWVLTTHGDHQGLLYQLDPQTGVTLNTLDVIGVQKGNGLAEVKDMATDGKYLWIREMDYLVQVPLP